MTEASPFTLQGAVEKYSSQLKYQGLAQYPRLDPHNLSPIIDSVRRRLIELRGQETVVIRDHTQQVVRQRATSDLKKTSSATSNDQINTRDLSDSRDQHKHTEPRLSCTNADDETQRTVTGKDNQQQGLMKAQDYLAVGDNLSEEDEEL